MNQSNRLTTKSILIAGSLAAVLIFGGNLLFSPAQPVPSYKGRSARFWLNEVFNGNQSQAFEAFRAMGSNASPYLISALQLKESAWEVIYHPLYSKLPGAAQNLLPKPVLAQTLRSAAELILLNSDMRQVAPQLAALLERPEAETRYLAASLLQSYLMNRRNQNADYMVPTLTELLRDTDPRVRELAVNCLKEIGPAAKPSAAHLSKLLLDSSAEVRIAAARSHYFLTQQTNAAIPILQSALSDISPRIRHWAAAYLLDMKPGAEEAVPIFISSLASRDRDIRSSAAYCLGRFGDSASAAIPALNDALSDPDPEVQEAAKIALSKIDPENFHAEKR